MCLVNNISVTLNISVEVKVSNLSVQTEIRLPKVQIAFFTDVQKMLIIIFTVYYFTLKGHTVHTFLYDLLNLGRSAGFKASNCNKLHTESVEIQRSITLIIMVTKNHSVQV